MAEGYVPFPVPAVVDKVPLGGACFLAGFTWRKWQTAHTTAQANAAEQPRDSAPGRLRSAALLFAVVLVGSFFLNMGMEVRGLMAVPYFAVALCGSVGLVQLSAALAPTRCGRWLDYVGTRTLDILTFHFLSFKAVSLAVALGCGLPLAVLSDFPVVADPAARLWCPAYVAVGVLLPLAVARVLHLKWLSQRHAND